MTVSVTLGMPTFNPEEDVFRRVLALALEHSADDVPMVVVDMSTTDVAQRVCAAAGARVRYEHFQSRGVSHSRNRCVELAQTRYVAFLDSDAYARPGWLEALVDRLTSDDRVAVAGSRIYPAFRGRVSPLMKTVTASDWLSLLDLGDEATDIPTVIGTSYAFDRQRVPDPPFDESRGRRPGVATAAEETLLCQQARAMGWRVVYEPASVVEHDIPAARASWRWFFGRAYAAGQEHGMWGATDALPRGRYTAADHAFRAILAAPFMLGRVRGRLFPAR